MKLHCVLAVLCFAQSISNAFAQSAVELKTPEVFLPVRDNGAKLRQGIFKASGAFSKSIQTINTQNGDDVRARMEAMRNLTVEERREEMKKRAVQMRRIVNVTMGSIVDGACDYDRNQFCFHIAHETDAVDIDFEQQNVSSGMLGNPDVKFIISPNLNAASRQLASKLYTTSLNSPNTTKSSFFNRDEYLFNGRTMGWGGRHAFDAEFSDGNLDYFARLAYQNENFKTEMKIEEEESGLKRVEVIWSWPNPEEISRIQTYWLDPKQGSQIVRFLDRTQVLHPTTQQHEQINSKPALGEATYSWEKVDDIWLVKTLDVSTRPIENSFAQWKLNFQWTSINKPVPDDMFDYRSWDLPEDCLLFDNRSGGGFLIPVKAVKSE